MKRTFLLLLPLLAACAAPAAGGGVAASVPAATDADTAAGRMFVRPAVAAPFTVSLSEQTGFTDLPALQSYGVGVAGDRWLLVGGRRNGLHAFGGDNPFPPSQANDSLFVVDFATGRRLGAASLASLPLRVRDHLSATNAQFAQRGDTLFVIGGYGADTSADTTAMITFPRLTAIAVSETMDSIVSGGSLGAGVEQVADPVLKVTGGDVLEMDDRLWLVFGQVFDGIYTGSTASVVQEYTERIVVLDVKTSPLSVAVDTVLTAPTAATNHPFHRRDLNVLPAVRPGGAREIAVYGGVFTPGEEMGAYQRPIYVAPDGSVRIDSTFYQRMTQYDAASLPVWDGSTGSMHTVLFGGISLYRLVLPFEAPMMAVADDGMPFIDQVTMISRTVDGKTRQYGFAETLPALLGAEMRFIPTPSVRALAMEDGVLALDRLAVGTPTHVGWLYGGIESSVPNTSDPTTQTRATNRVFRVTVTRGSAWSGWEIPASKPFVF